MRRMLAIVGASLLAAGLASAAEPIQELRASLDELHGWLGDGDKGRQWRQFLKSDQLQSQLADGDSADLGVVQQIQQIYESDTPGLQLPRFVAVRDALRTWTHELARDPLDLAEAIRKAKGTARRFTSSDVSRAKAKLFADLEALAKELDSEGEEQAAQWKIYLEWEPMREALTKDPPSLEVLNRSLAKFRGDRVGLERPAFTDVRTSLRDYMNRILFSSMDGFEQTFDDKIDELAGLVESYAEKPGQENSLLLGRSLGWFERSGQIPAITAAVRERFSHPNVFIAASQRFVAAGIKDEVVETQTIQDNILGTCVTATATMNGAVDTKFVPDSRQAALDITLDGTIFSDNVGYNRGVTIYSTGYTTVNATKRVYIDAEGLVSDYAATYATTSTDISCVAHPLKLVRKIAWNRIGQSKYRAEQIAAGRAAGRVSARVDRQAAGLLAESNQSFADKFRSPLIRQDSVPELLRFSTTGDHLLVKVRKASRFQVAAPGDAPNVQEDLDLVARIHESAIGNFSESMIGGVQLTDERIVELYKENDREVPPDLQLSADSEPWAITFSRTQPIRVAFAADGVLISVNCLSLHQGADYNRVNLVLTDEATNRAFSPEIRISREYDLSAVDGGIRLNAKSDLNVEFIGLNGEPITRYGLLHTSAKSLLTKKFGAMLTEQIPKESRDGLQLPGRWERAGKLRGRLARAQDGWLALGWEQTAQGEAADPPIARDEDSRPSSELLQTASASP